MAFSALFYTFSKRVNSTKIPSSGATSTLIELKEESDIINPTIVLSGIPNPYVFNFCYISEFERYYWVDNWRWIHGRWLASLHVDVLASYKTEIGASSQYVLRSASNYDGTITDGYYPKINVMTDNFTSITTNRPLTYQVESGYYIVGIISQEASFGSIGYYIINQTNFNTLKNALFSDVSWTNVQDISADLLKTMFNPYDYIVSCKWCPITDIYTMGDAVTSIKIGWWTFTINAYKIKSNAAMYWGWYFDIPKTSFGTHPQSIRGSYLNHEPYSQYYMNLAPYGSIALPTECAYYGAVANEYVDVVSGECELRIFYGSGGDSTVVPLLSVKSEMFVDIQLAQVKPQTNIQGLGVNAVGSLLSAGLNLLPDESPVKSTLSGVTEAARSMYTTVSTGGNNGGYAKLAMFGGFNAAVTSLFQSIAPEDNAHFGRPLCQTKTINTLSGYILCGDPDISIVGTEGEAAQIVAFLASGFYYE